MHRVLLKVEKYIESNSLLQSGDTVIVCVSGGADSVALLDILFSLKKLRLSLVVAHLDHMLRGDESDGDAAFVRKLAIEYNIPFEIRSVDVYRFSLEKRLSLEEGGRMARYAWFDELSSKHMSNAVALGHHADDQAETVLMRLLRGAGATGLSGIAPRSAEKYVRPLLCVTRTEIETYLSDRNIPFRTDGSNTDVRFLRNRVRHELLPYLGAYNPSIRDRLAATAEIISADEALLEAVTDQAFHRLTSTGDHGVEIDITAIRTEPPGLRFRIYRRAITAAKGNLAHLTLKHLRQIDSLVFSGKPNSRTKLPGSLEITRSYQILRVAMGTEDRHAESLELLIDGPGSYPLPGNRLLEITPGVPPPDWTSVPASKAFFDLDKGPFPWIVRTFRAGDRFTPLGMTGSRKIKDFFIDMKIPPEVRGNTPLLISNGTVLWIAGLRVAAEARITAGTREVMAAEIIEQTL